MIRLIALFGLLGLWAVVTQADIAEKKQELSRIQSEIGKVAANISRIENQRNTLFVQLADIEKHYGTAVASVNAIQREIDSKQQKLRTLSKESGKLQAAVKEQNQELSSQIKAAYAMGRKEKLKLLFTQQDPALSSRMLVYYRYLNHDRLEQLAQINDSLTRIDELEREKRLETGQLQVQMTLLQKTQAELADNRAQRKALLARLDAEHLSGRLKLKRLREGERRLQKLVESLQRRERRQASRPEGREAFAKLRGRLPWPAKGRIVKKFGSPRVESRWDGVLIAADEGAEVRAVSPGKVVYADWFRGYGLLTIIDHGGGFMTLYAFNQSLYKAVGEPVASGEIIATVGRSGGRRTPGLYFGIRRRGKPINPVSWCRR